MKYFCDYRLKKIINQLISLQTKSNGWNEVVKGLHLAHGPPVEQVWTTCLSTHCWRYKEANKNGKEESAQIYISRYIYPYIHIHISIYLCICVIVWGFLVSELTEQRDYVKSVISSHLVGHFIQVSFWKMVQQQFLHIAHLTWTLVVWGTWHGFHQGCCLCCD